MELIQIGFVKIKVSFSFTLSINPGKLSMIGKIALSIQSSVEISLPKLVKMAVI